MNFAKEEGLNNCHLVGGQGARLVRADDRGVAHCLAGVEVPHQVVVSHHLLDAVGQGEGDGEWKTFGHGDDEDGDADDDELDVVGEIVGLPGRVLQLGQFTNYCKYLCWRKCLQSFAFAKFEV